MIYGIGSDIIQIERIRTALERSKGRLAEKVLGEDELAIYHARRQSHAERGLAYLATRFAAKEAIAKAIGLGMHWPMHWRAIQTLHAPSGQPRIQAAAELAQWLQMRDVTIHITITDEKEYAVAFAVAEQGRGQALIQAEETRA